MFSLWTRTPMFCARREPLLIQTLAVALAGRVFDDLDFVTDARGAQLAELLGWKFNRVVTSLEALPADGLLHIWALGKLAALIHSSDDGAAVVHIDGDVLLFRPLPDELLRATLLAQSPDPESYYTGPDMDRGFGIAELPRGCRKWNAGLLGGTDVPLLRAYAFAALELANKFRDCDLTGTVTSMVIEQAHLGIFARRCKVDVGALFSQFPAATVHPHYAHLFGNAKRNIQLASRFGRQLREQFPEAAAKFDAGWPIVQRLFPPPPHRDCGCGCGGSGDCAGSEHAA